MPYTRDSKVKDDMTEHVIGSDAPKASDAIMDVTRGRKTTARYPDMSDPQQKKAVNKARKPYK